MTKRNVMIKIETTRFTVNRSLFGSNSASSEGDFPEDALDLFDEEAGDDLPESFEILMEGRLVTTTHRVELMYEEGELTGMEGSITSVGFDRACPEVISMMRTGMVSTGMVFEKGKRHMCIYRTPISQFEVCVCAKNVDNRLLTDGLLHLDYLVEIHGAQAERCRMTLTVKKDTSTL
jgi:uncharacterized beta-barrel protein YwiB (DUF1934 family)